VVAGGKWVATGGGGYSLYNVVPRAWTHLLATVAGRPLATDTLVPASWREYVAETARRTAPMVMGDERVVSYRPWREGYDPDIWLDRMVHQARMATFPLHGLDPMP
jgi:acetoin utilization protein AcuC